MDRARVEETVKQMVEEGRLSPGDTVTVSVRGDARNFLVMQREGTAHLVQVATVKADTVTYTLTSIDVAELADPVPVLVPNPSQMGGPTRAARASTGAIFRAIVMLLPVSARARYLEEWRGELYDLHAEGARWWTRAAWVLDVVLRAAPQQAMILRRRGRRAIE